MEEIENTDQAVKDREREIYKVTIIGSVANFILLIFKFAAGILGRSSAMIADAVHSLSDFITDIIVLVFVRLADRKQDYDHDYGHGKYETLATAIIGIALIVVGLVLLWKGASNVWGFFHGKELPKPGYVALIAALVSIAVKETIFRYSDRKSRKLHSAVLHANAWHHRSDALSSIGAGIGIAGAILFGDKWLILDPIASIIVSLLIIHAAVELIGPSIGELLEKSLPEYIDQDIKEIIMSFPQVTDPHSLRTRRIGNRRSVEVHIRVNGDMTVNDSHDITKEMERKLKVILGQDAFINIHVEPIRPYEGPLGFNERHKKKPSKS
ncbi:MAG: cation diffusion facilitator family transporter [Bacteroidales bacterium]|nr:cation diffusion facilitator family transporter [Bacteroidales bacterium]